jgi:hypothetical protein
MFSRLGRMASATPQQRTAIADALQRRGLLIGGKVADTDAAHTIACQLLDHPTTRTRSHTTRPHTPPTDRPLQQLLTDDLDRKPPTHREQRRLEAWLWQQRRMRNHNRWSQTL